VTAPERAAGEAWDREYLAGRYAGAPPVAFTHDILAAAAARGLTGGLYVGCGNGRNYLPVVGAGLDLIGLDVSPVAIAQLAERAPERRDRLVVGDLGSLPSGSRYDLVIGIQVFQHGDRATAHAHVRSASQRVRAGGLIAVRVNAVGTDPAFAHLIAERHQDSGFTVRYLEGPKRGLDVHFFSKSELARLLADEFEPVMPLRTDATRRDPPVAGRWLQWEGIWQRRAATRRLPALPS